ncbi:hypothetical protein [Consotaella salsifontis]|uniref:Uncharacterized protein n=1 Tax=Consotaella salsifontis TaxID=1365950 RepID=A0A1T4PRN1_9HYPH|nr:hypothetical protein [Consotaella salsifontis]SJZ93941.1 hypothetical protein SAMN05428963_104110 [Consotaella salsifontis]
MNMLIDDAVREAAQNASAINSILVVRSTARRIAAQLGASEEEDIDAVARMLIKECARLGVAMEYQPADALLRIQRHGGGVLLEW